MSVGKIDVDNITVGGLVTLWLHKVHEMTLDKITLEKMTKD
jgi:hypothetical protein